MAMDESLPYGLRDVKLATMSSTGIKGTLVDLPNSRVLSFSESEDFEELRGDDKVRTTRGKGASGDWDLESGGISLACLVIINGGTLTASGVTPAAVNKYRKLATDQRPDFFAEGQSISEGGGDFHGVLYRCKSTGGVQGEMSDGTFYLTKASGTILPSLTTGAIDALYDLIQNETAIATI